MLAVARRFLDDERDAQDVVQEAFGSAFAAKEGFRGDSAIRTWLHRIVVNAALKRLRTNQRRAETDFDELMPLFDEAGLRLEALHLPLVPADELIEQAEVRERVRGAIGQLPETYRTAIMLRDIEGYSTQEAAEALEISLSALKVRLHRGRMALKKLLEPDIQGRRG